jgi:hypothetical protein
MTALTFSGTVERDAQGQLEFFAHGADGALWKIQQTSPNHGWSGWQSLGAPPGLTLGGPPVVGTNGDGRLEVFSVGTDGNVWHMWQTSPNNGWSGWSSLGQP